MGFMFIAKPSVLKTQAKGHAVYEKIVSLPTRGIKLAGNII